MEEENVLCRLQVTWDEGLENYEDDAQPVFFLLMEALERGKLSYWIKPQIVTVFCRNYRYSIGQMDSRFI